MVSRVPTAASVLVAHALRPGRRSGEGGVRLRPLPVAPTSPGKPCRANGQCDQDPGNCNSSLQQVRQRLEPRHRLHVPGGSRVPGGGTCSSGVCTGGTNNNNACSTTLRCVGGANAGTSCTVASECPGGACNGNFDCPSVPAGTCVGLIGPLRRIGRFQSDQRHRRADTDLPGHHDGRCGDRAQRRDRCARSSVRGHPGRPPLAVSGRGGRHVRLQRRAFLRSASIRRSTARRAVRRTRPPSFIATTADLAAVSVSLGYKGVNFPGTGEVTGSRSSRRGPALGHRRRTTTTTR